MASKWFFKAIGIFGLVAAALSSSAAQAGPCITVDGVCWQFDPNPKYVSSQITGAQVVDTVTTSASSWHRCGGKNSNPDSVSCAVQQTTTAQSCTTKTLTWGFTVDAGATFASFSGKVSYNMSVADALQVCNATATALTCTIKGGSQVRVESNVEFKRGTATFVGSGYEKNNPSRKNSLLVGTLNSDLPSNAFTKCRVRPI